MKKFLSKTSEWFKSFFYNIKIKLKYRKFCINFKEFKKKPLWFWIIIGVVVIYVLTGVGFGFSVYKYRNEGKISKLSTKIFPYPAAWVGFKPVLIKDLFRQTDYILNYSAKSNQKIPDKKTIYSQILDQMIETTLLRGELSKNKLEVTKKDLDTAYKNILNEAEKDVSEAQKEDEFNKLIKELYGMSNNEFKQVISDMLVKDKVLKELLISVHTKHIFLKDEARANEVLSKLKNNEKSYEDLAKEYSEDSSQDSSGALLKDSGGDLGWVYRGQMVKEFEDAVFSMTPGQTSDVVKSQVGFHIIKVEEKRGKLDTSYDNLLTDAKKKNKIRKWF